MIRTSSYTYNNLGSRSHTTQKRVSPPRTSKVSISMGFTYVVVNVVYGNDSSNISGDMKEKRSQSMEKKNKKFKKFAPAGRRTRVVAVAGERANRCATMNSTLTIYSTSIQSCRKRGRDRGRGRGAVVMIMECAIKGLRAS